MTANQGRRRKEQQYQVGYPEPLRSGSSSSTTTTTTTITTTPSTCFGPRALKVGTTDREARYPTMKLDDLVFRPLDTTGDCTRFIQIEPADSDEDQIVCRHVHIAFRDRPKYEALSYKWGDVKDKETIILNGFELPIGKNLRAALRFLRRLNGQASYKLFWIDALCINQDELEERTRQVQWMGQIYFRARRVIVWLGDRYARYQRELSSDAFEELLGEKQAQYGLKEWEVSEFRKSWRISTSVFSSDAKPIGGGGGAAPPRGSKTTCSAPPSPSPPDEGKADRSITTTTTTTSMVAPALSNKQRAELVQSMAEDLVNDGYWQRLWIIQEIGQAREIQVCFGTWASPWSHFITFLQFYFSRGRPLALDKQLRNESNQSHTLKQLLEDHQDALCEDRRDKIYGLVGLAADATRFPMDYSKSAFEVWTDTMEYMKTHELLEDTDLIAFARLVRSLLMDDSSSEGCIGGGGGGGGGGGSGSLLRKMLPPPSRYNLMAHLPLVSAAAEADHVGQQPGKVPFEVDSYVLGYIRTLGPATADFLSKLDTVADWNAALHANYRQDVGAANKESRLLLRCVLDSNDEALGDMALGHAGGLTWAVGEHEPESYDLRLIQDHQSAELDQQVTQQHQHQNHDGGSSSTTATAASGGGGGGGGLTTTTASAVSSSSSSSSPSSSSYYPGTSSGGPRLYQLQYLKPAYQFPKLGIAPSSAQLGDLVCRVMQLERAVVVRIVAGQGAWGDAVHLRVVGTAVDSEDVAGVHLDHEEEGNSFFDQTVGLPIMMDARTLYKLIS